MLETIKSCINNLPNKSFDMYFQEYIMKMQDMEIRNEVDLTILFNHLDIRGINKQIHLFHKEFERNGKFN